MTASISVKTELALAILSFIQDRESLPCVLDLQLLQVVLVAQLAPWRREGKQNVCGLFSLLLLLLLFFLNVIKVIENIKLLFKDLPVSH